MYIKESIIIAIGLVIIVPLTGFMIRYAVMGLIRAILCAFNRSGKLYLFFANDLTFVGVVWHELSHALFAFITGAKVEKISFYHKEGDHLGCVRFRPRGGWIARSVQLSLSACAPVVMGMMALLGLYLTVHSFHLPVWGIVIAWYLFISVLVHMDMSKEDLESYARGIPFFLILFFAAAYIFFLTSPEI